MDKYIDYLVTYLKRYENKNVDELFSLFSTSSSAKSKNYILSQFLIGSFEGKDVGKAKIELNKINVKTIQLKDNWSPKEAMSFSPIHFQSIICEQWEESDFKKYLSNNFLFFVFKQDKGANVLVKIFTWKVPEGDLNGEIKLVWEDTKKKIAEGTIIKEIKDNKVITWFLTEKVTNICHVRPHGSNGSDVIKVPVKDKKTGYEYVLKHSFWFNHSYLRKIINEEVII